MSAWDDYRLACEYANNHYVNGCVCQTTSSPYDFFFFLHFNQSVTVECTLLEEAVSFARNFRFDTMARGSARTQALPVLTGVQRPRAEGLADDIC